MVMEGAPLPFLERSPAVLGENPDDLEEALITLDSLNSAASAQAHLPGAAARY
jgi:hypothetical protein